MSIRKTSAYQSPKIEKDQISLIREKAAQRWRDEEAHGQDEEHESERDPNRWDAGQVGRLEKSAPGKQRRNDGPAGQDHSADDCDP